MTAFRRPLPRSVPARGGTRTRTRTRTYTRTAALAVVCCLAVPPATAGASSGDGGDGDGHRSSGSAAASAVTAGGALLARPGVQVRPQARTPDLPSGLTALSWLVSDARTGQVLAAKNAHLRLPPASTLKTLFAVTVLPRFPRGTVHKVTEAELADVGAGSSLVGVVPGQSYTVADLWRGVFLSSGNDAVHVLAHMNGSVPRTVAQMQAKAEMLGAYDTQVVSPDGYDQPGQVSSAYDLAVFARAGLADRDFAEYASTATARFPGGCDLRGTCVRSYDIQNTNRLITGADGVTPYPGIVGVKNGYTTNAGHTLVAAARRGDRTLIATVMKPESGDRQAAYREAAELLDWGFSAAGRTTSVGTLNAVPAAFHGTPGGAAVRPTPSPSTPDPATARAANASATAWYIGGALALAAAVSVLLLRRRGGSGKKG
ncbi:D-alanyl-D-alanine carboxypeptidase family protein [Streptomyces sp.]|uniref:D-alanyl-D-alanine carboxypeptidase family protein n=1 Tax=Streptomyces sp. TaxID=1931 RepID=UPI002F3F01E6